MEVKQKEEKYLVLKLADIENYLSQRHKELLNECCDEIRLARLMVGKKGRGTEGRGGAGMMAAEILKEAPRSPATRPCPICGMPCRPRGLVMHERACERHYEDDDEYEFTRWVEQRKKLWRYRHKRDGQTRLEDVVE